MYSPIILILHYKELKRNQQNEGDEENKGEGNSKYSACSIFSFVHSAAVALSLGSQPSRFSHRYRHVPTSLLQPTLQTFQVPSFPDVLPNDLNMFCLTHSGKGHSFVKFDILSLLFQGFLTV